MTEFGCWLGLGIYSPSCTSGEQIHSVRRGHGSYERNEFLCHLTTVFTSSFSDVFKNIGELRGNLDKGIGRHGCFPILIGC